jgi:uncharacterized Fe-S cluster protein YjdI
MEKRNYTNGEVTIVWQPKMCIHSAKCWRGENALPEVFNPAEKPWINPNGASTGRIIEQVKACPSGALSFYMNNAVEKSKRVISETIAETIPNGPLLIYGNIVVKDSEGSQSQKSEVTAFCRCGASGNKPYCDGSHAKIDFKG